MEVQFRQTQAAQQQLTLTPSLRLSLEVLRMALVELQSYVQNQLEENPLLELSEESSETPNTTESSSSSQEESDPALDDGFDNLWNDANGSQPDEDETFSPMERSSRPPSLQEHLFFQLCSIDGPQKIQEIAQKLTDWLDADGYLRSPLSEITHTFGIDLAQVEQAMALLQRLDPPGVGARDLQECLLIQLRHRGLIESLAARIVRDHFDLLAHRKLNLLSSRLRVPASQVQEACQTIASLEPKPARNFSLEIATPLTPDLIIKSVHGGYEVELNDEGIPRFNLSRSYRNLLRDPSTSQEARNFIREKTRQGKWLMNAIAQRNETLLAIARHLLELETEYFTNGIQFLKPLTQEEIAQKVGCHPSTVSRAVAGKSIQTPYGVQLLESFFGGGFSHPAQGDRKISPKTVQAELENLIAGEDRSNPLSDQELVSKLAERGYSVARRTVAKYRNELKISPAYLRHPLV